MHGKSVSPLARVRNPTLSVWYQMFNSQTEGVSTVEMKSTARAGLPSGPGTSCVTSTTSQRTGRNPRQRPLVRALEPELMVVLSRRAHDDFVRRFWFDNPRA